MKKTKNESLGSLELLLDTMCNTFGGVMFIAISLTILAAAMPNVVKPVTVHDDNLKYIKELKKEISKLEQDALNMDELKNFKQTLETQLKNDPRLSMLSSLAEMEENIRKTEIKLLSSLAKKSQAEAELTTLSEQTRECEEKLQKEKLVNENLQTQIIDFEKEIAFVNKSLQSVKPLKSMTFKKLSSAPPGENPYFIIVKEGALWRIGPEADYNRNWIAHDDVSSQVSPNSFICIPKSGKRTNILLSGSSVSPDCLKLLKQLPPGRYPCFQVYTDSTKEFFELSETLKKSGISFDWTALRKYEAPGFTFNKNAVHERN